MSALIAGACVSIALGSLGGLLVVWLGWWGVPAVLVLALLWGGLAPYAVDA